VVSSGIAATVSMYHKFIPIRAHYSSCSSPVIVIPDFIRTRGNLGLLHTETAQAALCCSPAILLVCEQTAALISPNCHRRSFAQYLALWRYCLELQGKCRRRKDVPGLHGLDTVKVIS